MRPTSQARVHGGPQAPQHMLSTHASHSCFALMLCTHAFHSCFPLMLSTYALHSENKEGLGLGLG